MGKKTVLGGITGGLLGGGVGALVGGALGLRKDVKKDVRQAEASAEAQTEALRAPDLFQAAVAPRLLQRRATGSGAANRGTYLTQGQGSLLGG